MAVGSDSDKGLTLQNASAARTMPSASPLADLLPLRRGGCSSADSASAFGRPAGFARHWLVRSARVLAAAAALLCGVLALPATAQTPSVCDRTEQVRDAIVEEADVDDCAMVTVELLAGIRGRIDLNRAGITSLQSGDFAGLTGLTACGESRESGLAPA